MAPSANAFRWAGQPGHYEVYYLSATDPDSGLGLWIRYTMLAPAAGGGEPTCALWLMAMDPGEVTPAAVLARRHQWPATEMQADAEPFLIDIAGARLHDGGMSGGFDDVAWDLHWEPGERAYFHVHPVLARARLAQTVLTLPHADLLVRGTVTLGERRVELARARGGQAHLWGVKHARRWAWAHCNDLRHLDGTPAAGSFFDGVSVFVARAGREIGPSSPVVARVLGEDFASTAPWRVVRNGSRFSPLGWELRATGGARRLHVQVQAPADLMVGVTYHDPDGELAHCYNSEVATMRLAVWDRAARGRRGWVLRERLVSVGGAHFEYAQREALDDLPLHLR